MAIVWGWVIASFFTFLVSLSLGEICSAYPTSGALYFWSARLAGATAAVLHGAGGLLLESGCLRVLGLLILCKRV